MEPPDVTRATRKSEQVRWLMEAEAAIGGEESTSKTE
jgi:hypothetical protein